MEAVREDVVVAAAAALAVAELAVAELTVAELAVAALAAAEFGVEFADVAKLAGAEELADVEPCVVASFVAEA